MGSLIEPKALAVVGRRTPTQPSSLLVHDHATTCSGDQRCGGQTAQTTTDDVYLCMFHTHPTNQARKM